MRQSMVLFAAAFAAAPLAAQEMDMNAAHRVPQRPVPELVKDVALKVTHDRFNGNTEVLIDRAPINLGAVGPFDNVNLIPEYAVFKNGSAHYMLGVVASLNDWAFLRGSMEFLVDDKPYRFESLTEPDRRTGEGFVIESFTVLVPDDFFRLAGSATKVEIRLQGTHHTYEVTLLNLIVAQLLKMADAPAAVTASP